MGTDISEGKDSLLHTIGKDPQRLIKESMQNDGRQGEHTDADTVDQSFSAGRTVALANWEFARVSCGIKVGLLVGASSEDRDAAHVRCMKAVTEVLDREEASVRGEDREYGPVDLNGIGVKVSTWLDYGMTFKGKGKDSS